MPKTILVVDDSESIRTILKLTLQFKGYTVIEAEDGMQAYEILKVQLVDLLITDISMPKMTGLELLNKVRQEMNNTTLPIIICTAEKNVSEEKFLSEGANKILMKPVPPHEILNEVQNLI